MAAGTGDNFMKCCRICLRSDNPLYPIFKYQLHGNYAQMLTSIANVKVANDDGLPDKICSKCCKSLENAVIFKTVAEKSYKKLLQLINKKTQTKLPVKKVIFHSITDLEKFVKFGSYKTNAKSDPKDNFQAKTIMIANTVMRKVGGCDKEKKDFFDLTAEFKSENIMDPIIKDEPIVKDECGDDFFQDDNDDDYVPPKKTKVILKNKKTLNRCLSILDTKYESEKPKSPAIKNSVVPKVSNVPKLVTVKKANANLKKRKENKLKEKKLKEKKEKLICPVCGFLSPHLKKHIKTHDEKTYRCNECLKVFSRKLSLINHMKLHSGIKDKICNICGATYYTNKGLYRHMLTHNRGKLFACKLCPLRFYARCDLTRHMHFHSGNRPFKCSTCDMSFGTKAILQTHERTHTGERPYTCLICDLKFTYKVNLNNHALKSHKVNLRFKSIYTLSEDLLQQEMENASETKTAVANILSPNPEPTPVPIVIVSTPDQRTKRKRSHQ